MVGDVIRVKETNELLSTSIFSWSSRLVFRIYGLKRIGALTWTGIDGWTHLSPIPKHTGELDPDRLLISRGSQFEFRTASSKDGHISWCKRLAIHKISTSEGWFSVRPSMFSSDAFTNHKQPTTDRGRGHLVLLNHRLATWMAQS